MGGSDSVYGVSGRAIAESFNCESLSGTPIHEMGAFLTDRDSGGRTGTLGWTLN